MKIGVSGHRARDGADWLWVRAAIEDIFLEHRRAVGWSLLAPGADQIFAEAAMLYGAGHVAVTPDHEAYAAKFAGRDLEKYRAMLARSKKVIHVGTDATDATFRKAGERIVRAVDLMVLVWDGGPAAGEGGTADIAAYTEKRGVKAIILNPITCKAVFP